MRAKASDLSERELLESHAKALEAQVEGLRAEAERLRAALGMDQPWPLTDVLAKLIQATEHLLIHHDCDAHGHEEYRAAADYGQALLLVLRGADEIQPGEGDNRAVSTERRRNAAAVSGTPESYSRSDPRQDARTPAGDGVASPVMHADEARALLDEVERLRAREAALLARIERIGVRVDEAMDKVRQRL